MGTVTQENVHLLLPWKTAGLAELWAKDLNLLPTETLMRLYSTDFYKSLEDESTKMWTYSPEQLYYLFKNMNIED